MVLKMSVLGHIITLVAFFTTFPQFKVRADRIGNEAENVETMEPAFRAKRALDSGYATLAGELTPVFMAFQHNGKIIRQRLEPMIVKKALIYFKSTGFHTKRRRSVNDTINWVQDSQPILHLKRSKRDANPKGKFYYPSLLVVMDHTNPWPTTRQAIDELIYTEILYALAYWNEVEIQLRRIRNPGVRLRIAGIVIGLDKAAAPAALEKFDTWGYSMHLSLGRTLKYWQAMTENVRHFRHGTFNVVATMTDSEVPVFTSLGASLRFTGCGNYSSDQTGHLTNLTGLIVHDDKKFTSINQAVAEMSHIMGRVATGFRASVDASSFTREDLKDIKDGLMAASCWNEPLEIYPPGKPVERLFRTDFY